MRKVTPLRAFVAGIFGFGYVYVGRLALEVGLFAVIFGLFAGASWARIIMTPLGLYLLIAVMLPLTLVTIIHPIVIAVKTPDRPLRGYNRWWFYVLWVAAAGVITDGITSHRGDVLGYETFRIPSASMTPTLQRGDFIMLDAWAYADDTPKAGDVVVYQYQPGVNYVKRVVGVPGDQIEVRADAVIRNGEFVAEPYLKPDPSAPFHGRDVPALRLAAGEYYVLGDNRPNSRDSRHHGPVHIDRIAGRVEFIWFSIADWHRFPARIARDDG